MAVDPELLEILVCPQSREPLVVVPLPEAVARQVAEHFREHFRDEEPQVSEGLYCEASGLVYPVVSDIPILLIDEALPASVLG